MPHANLLIDKLALDRPATALLRLLPPERAHAAATWLLRTLPQPGRPRTPDLEREVVGIRFANPVGIAAGFDKDARAFEAALRWGFGAVEVGTVTPRPQGGTVGRRLFRLPAERAIINRFGFNNPGHDDVRARLEARDPALGVVGVNIGCNKDAADPIGDFVQGVRAFAPLCDYLTVNVSSPNTKGLRDLQHGSRLETLISAVLEARAATRRVPIFVKLAPDLAAAELAAVTELVARSELDGIVYSNTSTARPPGLKGRHAAQEGGLSGPPLRAASTAALPQIRTQLRPEQALIGVGGIASASDAAAKLTAGADLVQLYTGLVYNGLGLGRRLLAKLAMADADPAATGRRPSGA